MPETATVELDDLKRILREAAGEDLTQSLDGDILDVEFEELGYDSIALMETIARIEREYSLVLDDNIVSSALTPRALLITVNGG
ncbi:actinorhodin polyketide synthase acyl carrier protein (plasmid) [Pseudonocardia sp. EC080610-09]|uniref:acyl carrier protein n=1 Tax=unclassified Pseudonocardia TaxID=2619320 RepID=UPI0007059D9C|nr:MULTISPECIES: acyl carrier protein [unclassified Pseudonocardia]ALL79482.1 actinorhodin polyketide synthase acyl carrier protein [Pseudonocardia sp. EC080610-09]ALL85565.1 actinorhodin polyketide synthase acyl carrier protein [Pseudonocardia sp. EC080619-01]